jgi:uncharacterized protein (UPF0548 family)
VFFFVVLLIFFFFKTKLVGTRFAVLTRSFGIWVANACKILHVLDHEMSRDQMKRRSGFVYGTLTQHVIKGEERFWVELDLTDG